MDRSFDITHADALFLKGDYSAAFQSYFRGATEYRESRAACNLAYMYYQGLHVPRNHYMARKFYCSAARLEGGAALFNLALMELRGQGGEHDLAEAIRHMKQAAALDCIDARLYLGTAYTLGQAFDPVNIECICMIPYPHIIPRAPQALLYGVQTDQAPEDARIAAIEADETAAVEMFALAAAQTDDTYHSAQIGDARLLLGQALIEGFGADYDPKAGYRLLELAACENDSQAAAALLDAHKPAAQAYGVERFPAPQKTNLICDEEEL